MKNFLFILFSLYLASAVATETLEEMTGGFTTTNKKISQLINSDPLFAFSYGLARRSEEIKNAPFNRDAIELWTTVRQKKSVNKISLASLVNTYWDDLNDAEQELAQELDLAPHFWNRCEKSWLGPTGTNLLKIVCAGAILSGIVCVPAAAALAAKVKIPGTFSDSCTEIDVRDYSSTDPNLNDLIVVQAKCELDRACHEPVISKVVLTRDLACISLQNHNGSLAVNTQVEMKCDAASLKGSFRQSCTSIEAQSYTSSDSNIPPSSFCEIKAECKNKKGDPKMNVDYLPAGTMACYGQLFENCDGILEIRDNPGADGNCRGEKSEL